MLIFQWFAHSRIVREFPPFSFKVRIATLTRNQVVQQWARGFESHPVRQKIQAPIWVPVSFSLSKNSVLHQAGTAHFKQLLKKRAKKQKKSELFQLHVANFFRFMHANLSVTQFVTRAKPL